MRQVDARTGIEVMDRDECMFQLAGERVGRLAVVESGTPVIYPVNFVLDGSDVVFRSDDGTKVDAGLRAPVCFEVDRFDAPAREGWSVVISGRLEEERVLDLTVDGWVGPKPRAFRIVADRITGRRVTHA
jgi:nitroimidazol reductase NimA-like FMN-containing flavoprotein (pyridoxamine 5'-phosphate oxidase superfamily)